MPTYDYQCRSCGSITEVIHAMLEDGPSVCERCGGELRRVLYPAGIIFKGSGFYRTDSRKNDGQPASSKQPAESKGSEPTATGSEKKGGAPTGPAAPPSSPDTSSSG